MGQNPFAQGGMKSNPFGKHGSFGTTVDGEAKTVDKQVKRIRSANDE